MTKGRKHLRPIQIHLKKEIQQVIPNKTQQKHKRKIKITHTSKSKNKFLFGQETTQLITKGNKKLKKKLNY